MGWRPGEWGGALPFLSGPVGVSGGAVWERGGGCRSVRGPWPPFLSSLPAGTPQNCRVTQCGQAVDRGQGGPEAHPRIVGPAGGQCGVHTDEPGTGPRPSVPALISCPVPTLGEAGWRGEGTLSPPPTGEGSPARCVPAPAVLPALRALRAVGSQEGVQGAVEARRPPGSEDMISSLPRAASFPCSPKALRHTPTPLHQGSAAWK